MPASGLASASQPLRTGLPRNLATMHIKLYPVCYLFRLVNACGRNRTPVRISTFPESTASDGETGISHRKK